MVKRRLNYQFLPFSSHFPSSFFFFFHSWEFNAAHPCQTHFSFFLSGCLWSFPFNPITILERTWTDPSNTIQFAFITLNFIFSLPTASNARGRINGYKGHEESGCSSWGANEVRHRDIRYHARSKPDKGGPMGIEMLVDPLRYSKTVVCSPTIIFHINYL